MAPPYESADGGPPDPAAAEENSRIALLLRPANVSAAATTCRAKTAHRSESIGFMP